MDRPLCRPRRLPRITTRPLLRGARRAPGRVASRAAFRLLSIAALWSSSLSSFSSSCPLRSPRVGLLVARHQFVPSRYTYMSRPRAHSSRSSRRPHHLSRPRSGAVSVPVCACLCLCQCRRSPNPAVPLSSHPVLPPSSLTPSLSPMCVLSVCLRASLFDLCCVAVSLCLCVDPAAVRLVAVTCRLPLVICHLSFATCRRLLPRSRRVSRTLLLAEALKLIHSCGPCLSLWCVLLL